MYSINALAMIHAAACGTQGATKITIGVAFIENLTGWVQRLGVPLGVLIFAACVIGYFATKSTSPHNSGKFLGGIFMSMAGVALLYSAPAIVGTFTETCL